MKLYVVIMLLVMTQQMMMVDQSRMRKTVDLEVSHIIPHSLVSSNDALMQLVLLLLPAALFS
jgi:hypothetical protein